MTALSRRIVLLLPAAVVGCQAIGPAALVQQELAGVKAELAAEIEANATIAARVATLESTVNIGGGSDTVTNWLGVLGAYAVALVSYPLQRWCRYRWWPKPAAEGPTLAKWQQLSGARASVLVSQSQPATLSTEDTP